MAGAVLTGVGTALADNPSLTARVDGKLQSRQPLKVLVDSQLRVNADNRFFDEGKALVAYVQGNPEKERALIDRGAELLKLPEMDSKVNLKALLKELACREINEVHLEAGSVLTGEMLRQQLVDEIVCYLAPKVLGAGHRAFNLPSVDKLIHCEQWRLVELKQIGEDARLILRKGK